MIRRGEAGLIGAILLTLILVASISSYAFISSQMQSYNNTVSKSMKREEDKFREKLDVYGYPDMKLLEIKNTGDISSHIIGFIQLDNDTGKISYYGYDLSLNPMDSTKVKFDEMKGYPPYISGVITDRGNVFWDEVVTNGANTGSTASNSGSSTHRYLTTTYFFSDVDISYYNLLCTGIDGAKWSYSQDAVGGETLVYHGYSDVSGGQSGGYPYYTDELTSQDIGYKGGLYIIYPISLENGSSYFLDMDITVKIYLDLSIKTSSQASASYDIKVPKLLITSSEFYMNNYIDLDHANYFYETTVSWGAKTSTSYKKTLTYDYKAYLLLTPYNVESNLALIKIPIEAVFHASATGVSYYSDFTVNEMSMSISSFYVNITAVSNYWRDYFESYPVGYDLNSSDNWMLKWTGRNVKSTSSTVVDEPVVEGRRSDMQYIYASGSYGAYVYQNLISGEISPSKTYLALTQYPVEYSYTVGSSYSYGGWSDGAIVLFHFIDGSEKAVYLRMFLGRFRTRWGVWSGKVEYYGSDGKWHYPDKIIDVHGWWRLIDLRSVLNGLKWLSWGDLQYYKVILAEGEYNYYGSVSMKVDFDAVLTFSYPSSGVTWLSGWSYRRAITITERSGYTLPGYQIKIVLNSTNFSWDKVRSDGGDIRFVDDDNTTLLPYWIEKWDYSNRQAVIWVRVGIPASHTKTIYMYYGNPNASSQSSISSVLDEYATFDTGLNGWSYIGLSGYHLTRDTGHGNPAPSAYLYGDGGSRTGYAEMHKKFSKPLGVGYRIIVDYRASSYLSYSSVTNAHIRILDSSGNQLYKYSYIEGGTADTGWRYNQEVIVYNEIKGYTSVDIRFGLHDSWTSNWRQKNWYDNIMIFKYVDPEPTVSIGPEETA